MKIFIVRTPFAHRYIVEYLQNAEYYLKEYEYEYEWHDSFDDIANRESGIVFFFHTSYVLPIHRYEHHRVLLFNTEQLSNPSMRSHIQELLANHPSFSYVDYSIDNLDFLKPTCLSAWLPFLYHPRYQEKKPLPRVVPLLFYGLLSDYRKKLCSKYDATYTELYGNERDRMIRASKCVMNAHFQENYTVFESYRIHHAIFLGTPVFLADGEPERVSCLSENAKRYLLKSPVVPANLPPIDPEEEIYMGTKVIKHFISRLSLPKSKDPSTSAPHLH